MVSDSTPEREVLLTPLISRVDAAIARFNSATPNVHRLRKITLTNTEKDALIDGFESRTAAINRRLSAMLETLAQENADLCPYCSLDQNPDLDHILPKARFPEYSLYGRNLVPICPNCNRKKSKRLYTRVGRERIFLNPLFEPSVEGQILEAEISYGDNSLQVSYCVGDSNLLPKTELEIAKRHFEFLGLAARYRKRALGYLIALKKSVSERSDNVKMRALTHEINGPLLGEPVNGWKPTLFNAIKSDAKSFEEWVLN
ncbi:HNH endonuclease [Nisaea sediminum]|uniref:HNH endonuclease n=1 Tax=Nisaea sediminum TaxID=2775867 RepID=UPI00186749DD|nr:HNH endonuclease [Nisaea sediminum]